jgi:mannan endo-1,4-beta-mannosidase
MRFLLPLLLLFPAALPLAAPAQTVRLEAENAKLAGPDMHVVPSATAAVANAAGATPPLSGYSGSGYVTGLVQPADRVVFTYVAPKAGLYDLKIGYHCTGDRGYQLQINDLVTTGTFQGSPAGAFAAQQAGGAELQKGANTLAISPGWGHYEIDYLDITPAGPIEPPAAVTTPPSDPHATPEAAALLRRIDDIYGHDRGTLLGVYSDDDAQYVVDTTGFRPAIMGGDLSSYSPESMRRNPHPSQIVERLIARAREGYIVTLSWHWVPPFGLLNRMLPAENGKPPVDARWNRGFYTNATNFDVSIAMSDPDSLEHADLLRDIDAIAVQLRKFQTAGVPVLFRPLHEAQGGWFWWGAQGPQPYIQLWRMLYDRLVNVDDIHNLVWVYTSADSPAWYPGDAYVDVVGIDAYPTDLEDPQSRLWTQLKSEFAGRKPLAISEFGGVPDVERMQRMGIDWAYAVSWTREEGPRKNTPAALRRIYAGAGALKQKAAARADPGKADASKFPEKL